MGGGFLSPPCCRRARAVTSLRLLLLAAAIVEVDMLGCHLQAAGDNGHRRDELTVLGDNELLPLVLLLGLSPG